MSDWQLHTNMHQLVVHFAWRQIKTVHDELCGRIFTEHRSERCHGAEIKREEKEELLLLPPQTDRSLCNGLAERLLWRLVDISLSVGLALHEQLQTDVRKPYYFYRENVALVCSVNNGIMNVPYHPPYFWMIYFCEVCPVPLHLTEIECRDVTYPGDARPES